ncbi:MAG: DUF5655 domain-containing protein [Bacteroidota bacterium]
MWICPKCERHFKTKNQSHACETKDIGEFFEGKPDGLVLAFDKILTAVIDWDPNSVGPAKNAIVFANKKAWLIIKPMSKELDIKFYSDQPLESEIFKKVGEYRNVFVYHIRVKHELEVTEEVIDLLREGYNYAMK